MTPEAAAGGEQHPCQLAALVRVPRPKARSVSDCSAPVRSLAPASTYSAATVIGAAFENPEKAWLSSMIPPT